MPPRETIISVCVCYFSSILSVNAAKRLTLREKELENSQLSDGHRYINNVGSV